jgi:dipeptidyl aminopeptidase/acylaminoacyl peptidase
MTDLREVFEGVESMPAPDLWDDAAARSRLPSDPKRQIGGRSRVAAVVVAVVLTALSLFLVVQAFSDLESETRTNTGAREHPRGSLTFESSDDVFIVEPGRGAADADRLLDRDARESEAALAFAWSPDGTLIAFTDHDSDARLRLFVAAADGSGAHPVSPAFLTPDSPTWSPASDRIAFSAVDDGTSNLYTVGTEGEDVRKVTNVAPNGVDGAYMPAWSPAGSLIAYVSIRYDGATTTEQQAIALINAEGGDPEFLTEGPLDESPAWSPDGEHVAFVRKSNDGATLMVVALRGGSERLVARIPPAGGFAWSPVDDTVAFIDAATAALRVAALDGEVREIAAASDFGEGQELGSVAWTPDGEWISVAVASGRSESRIFGVSEASGDLEPLTPERLPAHRPLWRPE